eukprot:4259128-Amphidinium_carterae.1
MQDLHAKNFTTKALTFLMSRLVLHDFALHAECRVTKTGNASRLQNPTQADDSSLAWDFLACNQH